MNVRTYLAENFPSNEVNGGLYYNWPKGIDFELASGLYQFKDDGTYNEEMFELAMNQAMDVVNKVIDEEDDLFLVLDIFWDDFYQKTRIFSDYVKNQSLKHKATTERFSSLSEKEPSWTRFSVPCRKADLKLKKLIAAACNEDFPSRKPRFIRGNKNRYPNLYFINKTKNLVVFIYDDRGMEVVYKDFEIVRV